LNTEKGENNMDYYPNQKDTTKGNTFPIISLVLMVAPLVLEIILSLATGIMDSFVENGFENELGTIINVLNSSWEVTVVIAEILCWGARVASVVVLIYARVKYPDNVFAKVLMWVYIIIAALWIVFWAVTLIACGLAFGACFNDLQNCPG
jgi:hypothetical protein